MTKQQALTEIKKAWPTLGNLSEALMVLQQEELDEAWKFTADTAHFCLQGLKDRVEWMMGQESKIDK